MDRSARARGTSRAALPPRDVVALSLTTRSLERTRLIAERVRTGTGPSALYRTIVRVSDQTYSPLESLDGVMTDSQDVSLKDRVETWLTR